MPAVTPERAAAPSPTGRRAAPLDGVGVGVTAVVTVLAAVLLVVLWRLAATAAGPGAWDATATAAVVATRAPWLAHLGVVVSTVGSPAVMIAAVVLAGLVVARRHRRPAPALVAAGGLVALTAADVGTKDLVARPRPPVSGWAMTVGGYSFPSGHAVFAAGAVLLCGLLLAWSRRASGRPATTVRRASAVLVGAVVAGAVAVSRVVVGVHYPTDVLAGVMVAVVAVGTTTLLAQWALGRRERTDGAGAVA